MVSLNKIYLNDIEYTHLLYNSFGPITCKIQTNLFIKFQTNNGTGKTILLKTLMGLLIPKLGFVLRPELISTNEILNHYRLSNSQSKKYKLLNQNLKKHKIWLFDEPYSFLDMTSIIFYKKKIISHCNKKGSVLFTDCIKRTMLPCIIYYSSLLFI